MSIHPFGVSLTMAFLQALRLKISLKRISALSVDFREKARLANGALMSGGRHAMSVPLAIMSTMKNAENLIGESNPGQNLKTCLKIMSVLSVQLTRILSCGTGMLSSRDSLPSMTDTIFF